MMAMRRLDGRATARGWRACALAAALPLALALGACSSDSPQPSTVNAQDTSSQPYPNLATVPDKPPPVSPEEIRASTAEGLAADRANAQYSNTLTAEGTAQPAAQPPGPPPPEPVVKVTDEKVTTEERITESGVVEETEDDTVTETVTQNGRTTTVTETEDTEVAEAVTGGGAIAQAEVEEADADEELSNQNDQNNDTQDSNSVIDDTDDDVAGNVASSPGAAPAPGGGTTGGTTTTAGGVTEVTSLTEVCKVASDWERKAYGCDNIPSQPQTASQPAPAQTQPAQTQPATTQPAQVQPAQPQPAQPAYTSAPAPAQPALPPPPAYSPTPPAPAPGTPQTASTPGQQAPLSINPPAGSAQPVPSPSTAQPSPSPTYTPPAGTAQPQPVPQPAPGGATQVTSMAEVCKVAEPWERKAYGCDNPQGQPAQPSTPPATTQQATAPSYAGAAPPLVPAPGTVGTGRVELVGVIFFAHGSSALDGRDAQVIQQIAALHKQYGGIVRVVGNASARTGNMNPVDHELANFEVSMERAGAVAAMLTRYGVASTAIVTEARSDTAPVYHEFMPSGEAGNRRAEIYLEY